MDINILINGKEIIASVDQDLRLMNFLRDYLDLTGTKNGCARIL